MKADTPLFRQYQGIKSEYPDKLLFFRMGDFYELFYSDAERAAALLGITLTKRKTSLAPIPMAGVPVHSVEQYISRLVRIGESIVVCEQVGEGSAGLMERKVTQIVTPGTLTDQALLPERSSCIAMAIMQGASSHGYAWLDLARGELRAGECASGEIASHAARLQPAELLLPEGAGVPAGISASVRHLPEWDFEPTSARHRMCERFGVQSLEGFGLENLPLGVGALMALLDYAEHTQCQRLDHIWRIGAEVDSEQVAMDATARRSLELTQSATADGPTLLSVLDRCVTSMGSRMLARRLHNPLRNIAELESRLDACDDLKERSAWVREWLAGCGDVERITTRISLATVSPRELESLRAILADLPPLAAAVGELADRSRDRYGPLLEDYSSTLTLLRRYLAEKPAPNVREGGVIAAGFDADLDRLRSLENGALDELQAIEERERQKTGLQSLRVGNNRVHGYYIEIPRSQSPKVPERFVRRQTTKHAERYVTEELSDLETEVANARDAALELERRLYEELVTALKGERAQLRKLADSLADLDIAAMLAELAEQRSWVRPALSPEPGIRIDAGRHPVVEAAVDHFVPNDASLSPDHSMKVVTGPNMGGKSTYMRQVALIALLAHVGAPVPAARAEIGLLDSIMTRIGASDDLAGGRSTFMVEMAETAAILNMAGPATLVILDEIGRGTSTYDGLSLAWATAQTLLERNKSLVLIATHYLELAQLAEQLAAADNVHMAVGERDNEVVMLYRIEPGASSKSFGLQVARMAGVPKHTIRMASARLADLEKQSLSESQQSVLFQPPPEPEPNPSVERLRAVRPDELSPRQALELLYELRDLDSG